nr:HAMP domain-containing histidine kinase [Actinomycetales bacterium]
MVNGGPRAGELPPAVWVTTDQSLGFTLAAVALLLAAIVVLAVLLVRTVRAHQVTRQEAERLRDLAKDRAQRISTLSHEVRTPLALIKGAGELIADGSAGTVTEQQRRFADTITENCTHVIELAEGLLSQARLEAHLFELRLERIDLRAFVRDAVRELRRVHSVLIQLDNHGRPITVMADARLLREALWNLGNNAVRHAGTGATVTFRVERGEDQAIVAVADDGQGMDSSTRSRIFEPFQTTSASGTGLGLSITKMIIELHRGRVLVDTAARHGTIMYLTLPTKDEDD